MRGRNPIVPVVLALATSLVTSSAMAQETCKPKVKENLEAQVKSTPEAVAKGKAAYEINCIACHGDKGLGDGPAGSVLNPRPRNFAADNFVNGASVLGIYKTLTLGLNAGMPGFEALPDDERIALAHYVRSLMPQDRWATDTPEQLNEACIEISNPKLPSIPVDLAMTVLAEEADAARKQGRADMGPVKLNEAGDAKAGEVVFGMECASCHGNGGAGIQNYGRHGRFPYVQSSTWPLQNFSAAGDWSEFADRSASGVHSTLPEVTGAATLSEDDWKNVHAYVASFAGGAKITTDAPPPPAAPRPGLIGLGEGFELFINEGRVFKLVTATVEGEAPVEQVASWEAFRGLYKGADPLPETLPEEGFTMTVFVGMECIGRRTNTEETKPGCQALPQDTPETEQVTLNAATFAVPTPTPEETPAPQ